MKQVVIGAHLLRDDVEPLAEAIPAGDLFLSALAVAGDQPLGDRELLIRVANVRAKLLDTATFVAIRYGVSVTSPDDALGKCAAHLARWKQLLTAHRNDVEMTLKVAVSSPASRPDRHRFASGAEYLRALHAATQAANVDPQFRETCERLFTSYTRRWMHRDERSAELALLVPREEIARVNESGATLRENCPHVPFLLSGPWPLEVFADDHE